MLISEATEDDLSDDSSKDKLLGDSRQAWHEATTGQTISTAQLWEEIEDDQLTINSD